MFIVAAIISFLLSALAVYIMASVVPGISFRGDSKVAASILFALVLAVLNALLRPVIAVLSLPATVLTLGLFSFVVNAIVLMAASAAGKHVGKNGIEIDGFVPALIGALVLAVINALIGLL